MRCTLSSSALGPPHVFLLGHAQNTSPRRCPGGILVRFLKHLSGFPFYAEDYSTLNPSQMTKLFYLTTSKVESRQPLEEANFSLYPQCHFSVITQRSWPMNWQIEGQLSCHHSRASAEAVSLSISCSNWRGHSTLFQPRTMASDLEVLILIPRLALPLTLDKTNGITSSTKNRYEILKP